MRQRLAATHQRGFIGEILVFVIGFLLIGGGVTALVYSLKLGAATVALALNNGARMALVEQFQPDARSAMFVGILPTDINGNAQGSSGTANELDFYTRDSAHNPYLWAYNYNAATQTVQRYCFTDPTTHANLKACGQPLSNVTAFTVTVQTASSAATGNLALAGTTIQNIAPQGLSVPGVTSSNQVVTVHLVTTNADELHTLVAGIGPTGYTTIVGRYWKPGPLLVNGSGTGFAVDEPVGQSLCYYQSDGSTHNPCTVGVTEQYYGGGGEDTPGNFANCNSGVTISPSTAAGESTSPVTFTITSTSPQACTTYIVDDHGGSDPLQITIWGPLVTNPAKLDFLVGGNTNPTAYNAGGASEGADPNGSITVSEQNYPGPFTLTDGDASGNNTCGSNVNASWNGGGWNISTPPSATPGDCIMNIMDGHGGKNFLDIHIGAPLLVNTGSGFATSGSLTWAAPTSSQTYQVQELVYTGPFTVASTCSGGITDTLSTGTGNGTTSGYTVTPSAGPLSCTITATDNRGNSATVAITVQNPALIQQFVCDPSYPPAPYDTDLGPDPDGIHEDYSNGTSCPGSTPTPSSTSPATPVGSMFSQTFTIAGTSTVNSDGGGGYSCSQTNFTDSPSWFTLPYAATASDPITISVSWSFSHSPPTAPIGGAVVGVQDPTGIQGYVTTSASIGPFPYPGIQSYNPTVVESGAPAGSWAFGVQTGCPIIPTNKPAADTYTATATITVTQN